MAQRYGGKFSPNPDAIDTDAPQPKHGSFRGAKRTRAGGRVNLLFLAPLPLAIAGFTSEPAGLAVYLGAMGLLLLAAWMTREGILAHEAYDARRIARRPGFPRKIAGSALTGLGLALAGIAGAGPMAAVIFGVLGAGLHSFAYGLDPLKDKGMDGVDTFQTDRVARAVAQAEAHLAAMSDAIKRAGDRQAEARVERFQVTVRDMLRTVEEDPRDLTAAKRYMGVYLMGARDATIKFADIYGRSQDHKARSDYMMLLTDLEDNFTAKTRKLLLDNNSDLEIEISVLRDRLSREGVHLTTNSES